MSVRVPVICVEMLPIAGSTFHRLVSNACLVSSKCAAPLPLVLCLCLLSLSLYCES
jgi:hypothetical protein